MQNPAPHSAIEAKIKALFDDASLSLPLETELAQLVNSVAYHGEDLTDHYAMIQGVFGGPGIDYRHAVGSYCLARELAADPMKMVDHLLSQASRLEEWATSSDREAGYRQRCADDWVAKGYPEDALEYQQRADSERRFAAKCRADAATKRARATAILADQADRVAA